METWFQCTRWTLLFISVTEVFSSAADSSSPVQQVYGTVGTSLTFSTRVPLFGTIVYDGTTIGHVFNKHIETGFTDQFKSRLHWDNHTAFLTLSDLRMEDSGSYTIESTMEPKIKQGYQLDVYENVSAPQVTSFHSSSDNKLCSLMCSVENVRGLTLLWYKGSTTLNHTNSSILKVTLSLPLEIEKSESSNFRCVASNPVSNKTTTANEMLCSHSADDGGRRYIVAAVLSGCSVMALVAVVGLTWRKWLKGSSQYTEDSTATEGPHGEIEYSVITHKTDSQGHIRQSSPEDKHNLTTVYDQIHPRVHTSSA